MGYLDPKKLRIGCSGWSYEDWIGPFYPKNTKPGDYLRLYSTIFDAVEIDSTYYRTPSTTMVSNWKHVTPNNFVFSPKFPKKITHELKLRDSLRQLEWFYKSMSQLGDKLGPLVIQLPPSFNMKKDNEALISFLGQIDRTKYQHAIEFRNKSWFKPETYKILEQHDVGLAWSENQYVSTPPETTADFQYLRMVGDRSITNFNEKQRDQTETMKKWYTALEEKSDLFKQGYVFFNNHFAGFGPGSVNEFRRLVGLENAGWIRTTTRTITGKYDAVPTAKISPVSNFSFRSNVATDLYGIQSLQFTEATSIYTFGEQRVSGVRCNTSCKYPMIPVVCET
jgi:uncharacterized protein YecE (DUF72 family)